MTAHDITTAPPRAAMADLGSMPIAGILGTHQANLDERARLLGAVETDLARRVENELALFRVEKRLYLYAELTLETEQIVGTSHEG